MVTNLAAATVEIVGIIGKRMKMRLDKERIGFTGVKWLG